MALPDQYRIIVKNSTGVQVDSGNIEVDIKPWTFDTSTGGISHGSEQTFSLGSNLSAGTVTTCITVSSSTDVGLQGNANGLLSSNGSTPDGDLEFFIERSTDGGSSYERDPVPVAILSYDSSKADKTVTFIA